METYYLVQIINGSPVSKTTAIESDSIPNIVEPFTDVWTEQQWFDFMNSVPEHTDVLSKEEIHKLAENYQDLYYDNRGVTFLLNIKQDLIRAYQELVEMVLPYQMIEAASRWVNKVWSRAFYYDTIAAGGIQPNINFELEAGLPPCKFRDIMWVLDSEFQALEPDRVVNQDINYYLNWA
jgi:hypothetical protein